MKPDDEEKPNGYPKSNGSSIDEDKSTPTVDATTPRKDDQASRGKDGGDRGDKKDFVPLSVVSVNQQRDNDEQLLGKNTQTKSEQAHSCHTRLEIIVKGLSDQKQNGDKTQGPSRIIKDENQENPPAPKPLSRRALRQSRGAWKAMQLPHDFEKVFEDSCDSDSSSGSSSDSDSEFGGAPPHRKKADDVSSWADSVVSEMKPEDVDDDSPSRLEWLRQKREDNEENQFLDQLMSMVGLEEVKAHFLAVKARVKRSKADGTELANLRLHLVLQGKDGTGES